MNTPADSSFDPVDVRKELRRFSVDLDERAAGLDVSADIRTVLMYLHEHLFEHDLSAGGACIACGFRDHNFTTRFKHEVGTGMSDYITAERIRMARLLLITFPVPVMEIGWLVGYDYSETFARSFRRVVGESATSYRAGARGRST